MKMMAPVIRALGNVYILIVILECLVSNDCSVSINFCKKIIVVLEYTLTLHIQYPIYILFQTNLLI